LKMKFAIAALLGLVSVEAIKLVSTHEDRIAYLDNLIQTEAHIQNESESESDSDSDSDEELQLQSRINTYLKGDPDDEAHDADY